MGVLTPGGSPRAAGIAAIDMPPVGVGVCLEDLLEELLPGAEVADGGAGWAEHGFPVDVLDAVSWDGGFLGFLGDSEGLLLLVVRITLFGSNGERFRKDLGEGVPYIGTAQDGKDAKSPIVELHVVERNVRLVLACCDFRNVHD